jgi:HEAT repeat protein
MRTVRSLLWSCLPLALCASCSSGPEETIPAPERDFEVDAGTELASRGSLMLEAKKRTDAWLGAKSKTPRDVKLERRQGALENSLRDFSERHRAALLDVLRTGGSATQRSSAALCLGFAVERRDEVLETLIGVLERDGEDYVRSDVLVGLGALAHPRTPLDPVMDVIERGKVDAGEPASFSMRARAAFCLLRTTAVGAGDPALGDRIAARLADPNEDLLVSSQLARAIAGPAVRTAASIGVLTALLDHTAPRVVTAAVMSLAEMQARSAGPELVEKLAHEDPSVRIAARAALRDLFGRDEGVDVAAWRRALVEEGIGAGGS